VLVVFAAPLFDEFVSRRLIFGGLRRAWSAGPATLASTVALAIVHPHIDDPCIRLGPLLQIAACRDLPLQHC
jgi:hypothetical protein